MKKIIMAVIGILLFVAGHNYIRRQAEYKMANKMVATPAYAMPATTSPLKSLPIFAFRLNKAF